MEEELKAETKRFLEILFNEDDAVWVTNRLGNTFASVNQEYALSMVGKASKDGIYLCYNPARANRLNRNGENVKCYRNILIEFDGLELGEQVGYVNRAGIPYSTVVYSGGRSNHFLICLEDPLDYETYRQYWARIVNAFPEVDSSVNRGASYSRLPNGYRKKILQNLVYAGARIPNEVFTQFLETLPVLPPPEVRATETPVTVPVEVEHNHPAGHYRAPLIDWYVNGHLGLPYENRVRVHVQCPACAREGHDTHGDNLSITVNPDRRFNCFANPGPEHGKLVLAAIRELRGN